MRKHKPYFLLLLLCMTLVMLTGAASAKEIQLDSEAQFCFSADDFGLTEHDKGVFFSSVPSSNIAKIYYGNRQLRSGDAVPRESLNDLVLKTACKQGATTSLSYFAVSGNTAAECNSLKFSIMPRKNEAPRASDSTLETYRNIANNGTLDVTDPEGDPLTYQIVTEPKRGSVEIHEDGTFTYTPDENKVGKDCFTYTATDDSGHVSSQAKVSIEIKKPSDKQTYADMTGDSDAFSAMWMKEEGLFRGTTIGTNLCFEPEKSVTRGEFLVMTMKLVGAEAAQDTVHSGFTDEDATPVWMQPYIVSALSNGMISGTSYEDGMVFRSSDCMTHAEAAVMLQNILQLPGQSAQAVISFDEESTVPTWAEKAVSALSNAGIEINTLQSDTAVTRRDAANILYRVSCLVRSEAIPTFYWTE